MSGVSDRIDAAIHKAEAHQNLNSLIGFNPEHARQRAAQCLAELSQRNIANSSVLGQAFVVKDNIAVHGMPLTGGCPAFAGYYPTESAAVIQKLVAAGAFVLGKANLHELAFGITSANKYYGDVLNPCNADYLAGGSSGGCAAAVACGMVPFAVGNDTGGSIRIPAALCGVVGFRPSTGRYSTEGVLTLSPTRDTIGTMARSVREIAELDRLLAAPSGDMPFVPAQRSKRIAVPREPFWSDLSEEMSKACEEILKRLATAGYELVEVDASELRRIDEEIGFVIAVHETWREWCASVPRRLGMSVEAFTPHIASDDVRSLFEMMATDQCPSIFAYQNAMNQRVTLRHAYQDILVRAEAQFLLMPTTLRRAMLRSESKECWHNESKRPTFPTFVRQTSPASVAGCPSLSLPGGQLSSGLPFGLLLEALPGQDRALLDFAEELVQYFH